MMRIQTASRLAIVACSLLSLLLSHIASASAGIVEYRYDSGTCANGRTWVSVSCYIGGVFIWADGVDCDGWKYERRGVCPTVKQLTDDPTEGLIPTHTGETEAGPWRSVIVRDASGIPISVVGVSETGSYYSYDCIATGAPDDARYE